MKRLLARLVAGLRAPQKRAVGRLRGIVDEAWYAAEYPDIGSMAPADHFVRIGAWQGRRPNRFFDPDWYRRRYPEAAADLPIVHYALIGRRERLDPGPAFGARAYLDAYPDVAAGGAEPLEHYVRHGKSEERVVFPAERGGSRAGSLWGRGGADGGTGQPAIDALGEPETDDEMLLRLYGSFRRRGGAVAE